MPHRPRPRCRRRALFALALLAGPTGCVRSPLAAQSERDLRDAIARSLRRELMEAERFPEHQTLTPDFGFEELKIDPRLLPQLEAMAGPRAYDRSTLPLSKDLLGQDSAVARVALDKALQAAAANNLEIQFQRYAPAIAETQVTAAEAAFDWSLFSRNNWLNSDEPRVSSGFGSSSADQRQNYQNQFGLRRNLPSGGQFTIQQDLDLTDVQTPVGGIGVSTDPDPQAEAGLTLQLDQPVLRGFGSDVAYAQTRLAINAERDQAAQLKGRLIRTVTEAEQAYWQLYQAEWDLLILQKLLERGMDTRSKIEARGIFDAAKDQIANANAEVQGRLGLVIAARDALRRASDDLKRIMNDPDLTVGSETLVRAIDEPIALPIEFGLLDSILAGVRNRPEVQQAIISIDDTSIRQVVADNARLPQLDLRLQARWGGLDDDFGEAYEDLADGQFVSYLVGLVFEYPLGNRRAEAQYVQRRLERQQAVIAYANTVQSVVKEVKDELRRVVTNYKLVEQARLFRIAQTENLRAFEVKLELVEGFTSELLDLWLQRQQSVARAEQAEVGALINYNIAIARFHAAMGTALERNQIDFVVPDGPIPRAGR